MVSNRLEMPFGELTENFDSFRVPVKESERHAGPFPYYGASGIVDYVDSHIFDGEYLLIAEDGENLRTRNTPIAFMAKGKFWVNNHAHIVRGNKKADTRFLLYALSATDIRGYLTGSTMPKLTQDNLKRIPVFTPSLSEQHAIAHILGTLDDKIELNRKMNETLEQMARALFKSWFVDFDPVRRNAGRPSPLAPLPKGEGEHPLSSHPLPMGEGRGEGRAFDHLFPSRFVDSELGEIPEGWEVGMIGHIAEHPRRRVQPDSITPDTPYIALEHMPKQCIALSDWGVADGLESNKFEFRKGEILFGKLRPYFHKVGVAPIDGICSTDIVVVVPRFIQWFGFILGHVSSVEFVEYANAGSTGTKMPRTSWHDMALYTIALPSKHLAAVFTNLIQSSVDRIVAGIHEALTLATLRDTLLPALLSGELSVSGAKRTLETQA